MMNVEAPFPITARRRRLVTEPESLAAERAGDPTDEVGLTRHAERTVLSLDILNELESIDHVNEAFNTFAERHAIPDGARRTFNIAFDDLINNIVSYGYDDAEQHRIHVEVALDGSTLQATLIDDGTPFDPFAMDSPDLEAELDERRIGGLGVHLVRTMMDECTYERTNDRNVVVIRKFLRQDNP